ncbi:hypothetical protein DXG01_017104 [Tephrocybe rancida]|nr:hypothetical protein DXG01_017104 [Tephrocybe rancida]
MTPSRHPDILAEAPSLLAFIKAQTKWLELAPTLSSYDDASLDAKLQALAVQKYPEVSPSRHPDPLISLQRTSHEPSDTQKDVIRGILNEKKRRLLKIELDILRAQLELGRQAVAFKKLQRAGQDVEANVRMYKALLPSVRRLPVDVLGEIFKYALAPRRPLQDRRGRSPVPLSHVCSVWRDAAIHTSSLWTDLKVDPNLYRVPHLDSRHIPMPISTRLSQWSSRARTCPMSLTLIKLDITDQLSREGWCDLSHGIQSIAHHITKFYTSMPRSDFQKLSTLQCPGNAFPAPEILSFDSIAGTNFYDLPVAAFTTAPRLRRVILDICHYPDRHHLPFVLPWSQLTHLEIRGLISFGHLFDFLFACSAVEYARFGEVNLDYLDERPTAAPQLPVALSHLAMLKIHTEGRVVYLGSLATFLNCRPELEVLTLFVLETPTIDVLPLIPTSLAKISSFALGCYNTNLFAIVDAVSDLTVSWRSAGAPLHSLRLSIEDTDESHEDFVALAKYATERIGSIENLELKVGADDFHDLPAFSDLGDWIAIDR